uniref:Floricaula/leafy-like transcription factor n=1 Tax=Welwitschia mirabilis TaxID=3377 RepID=Q9S7J3_WELMI|nr:WelNdly protein [Welwitschia mirabilis]AAD41615.1 NEEDLY homolog [Welwitschia mirabilis]
MDAESFNPALGFYKWEQRNAASSAAALAAALGFNREQIRQLDFIVPAMNLNLNLNRKDLKSLEDLFKNYGVRYLTLAKMSEMGFTASTLINMTEEEIDELMKTLVEIYHVDLLIGERYGIKSAVRAEKKRLQESLDLQRLELLSEAEKKRLLQEDSTAFPMIMASEGTSKELRGSYPESASTDQVDVGTCKETAIVVQQNSHVQLCGSAMAGMGSDSDEQRTNTNTNTITNKKKRKKRSSTESSGEERPREHPFIVTEPGELARGKKNGLDYLFDLYEQCSRFLLEVQRMAKEKGEKCPNKVTNQVFRHAKHNGAVYINKPKMRHYVHCYALHCLNNEQSNQLRRMYKARGENVGVWRQACYYPLVMMAKDNNWDIDGVFNRHEKLKIWYVPTKLRQLCHLEKSKLC